MLRRRGDDSKVFVPQFAPHSAAQRGAVSLPVETASDRLRTRWARFASGGFWPRSWQQLPAHMPRIVPGVDSTTAGKEGIFKRRDA